MKSSRLLAAAYLLHLLAPALLFLDIVTAGLEGRILPNQAGLQIGVAAVAALWLLTGLGFYFLSRDRQLYLQKMSSPLLSIYVFYLMFGLGEVFVRVIGFTAPIPFMQMGTTRAITKMDPAIYPGISGTKRFTINSLGLRGPMPPKGGRVYRIVTVGGSTTICANLDDSEEWPHRLMISMNASQPDVPVWIGNAGGSGMNAVNHIVLMQWLPGVIPVNMVIFLVGVNDLAASLAFHGGPTEVTLEKDAQFQGALPPGTHWRSRYPRYERLVLLSKILQAVNNIRQWVHPPKVLPLINVEKLRQRRAAAAVLPLPDLATGLMEFRARIVTLADQCRNLKVRCLFLTQTSMWRSGLSPAEQRLLWMGYTGPFDNPAGYISAGDMGRAMDMYNHTLLDVCGELGLECFDVASTIPKDTSAYFDDMHFNENGARLMAQSLQQYLVSKPPFSK